MNSLFSVIYSSFFCTIFSTGLHNIILLSFTTLSYNSNVSQWSHSKWHAYRSHISYWCNINSLWYREAITKNPTPWTILLRHVTFAASLPTDSGWSNTFPLDLRTSIAILFTFYTCYVSTLWGIRAHFTHTVVASLPYGLLVCISSNPENRNRKTSQNECKSNKDNRNVNTIAIAIRRSKEKVLRQSASLTSVRYFYVKVTQQKWCDVTGISRVYNPYYNYIHIDWFSCFSFLDLMRCAPITQKVLTQCLYHGCNPQEWIPACGCDSSHDPLFFPLCIDNKIVIVYYRMLLKEYMR